METNSSLHETVLADFHVAHGARMVPFAGWNMPVQYADGIKAEHLATRNAAGLFDVSHMAQVWLSGDNADAMLEALTPTDVAGIAEGRVRYSMFLNETGGVLDDLMIARLDGMLQLVVNAGRADHDIAHLEANLADGVDMTVRRERALLALQGPAAPDVLARLGVDLDGFFFMQVGHFDIAGIPCIITRSGYTGEDGFEISMPVEAAQTLAERLVADEDVSLAGLGARDTLRLEAGLPLWGHELDETINPVAAGLRLPCRSGGGSRRFPRRQANPAGFCQWRAAGADRLAATRGTACPRRRRACTGWQYCGPGHIGRFCTKP